MNLFYKESFLKPNIIKIVTMNDDWDFEKVNTKELTHGFHTYPAMMIPQVARKLINIYGKNAKTLLDPFMGSGTSLVESSISDNIKQVWGFDLNPLAVLISKVKTTIIERNLLLNELKVILNSRKYNNLPNFKNINFWFKQDIIEKLAMLKNSIDNINDENIKNFFLVVFSETIRKVSNTRKKEFKLYRMSEEQLKKHNPNVFNEFKEIAEKNINALNEYAKYKKELQINPLLINTTESFPIKQNSIDLIVTSPPYGDSKTTVAYGQFSRLTLQWLNYENANILDNKLLGGIQSKNLDINIKSKTLKSIINEIAKKDSKRAREVLSFYEDFNKCVINIDKVMAKNGYLCFVVGNRTVKELNIPTDKIMVEMFKAVGDYEYITTYNRRIPNKRMPLKNSPTNEKGKLVTTMNNEYIFVLKKN